jgi:hypothetical protein
MMAYLWEDYDSLPSNNTSPPPIGAPEGTTKMKNTNEIDRRMMAAISEIGEWVQTTFATLQGMSTQDPTAVNIDGGTLDEVFINSSTITYTSIDGMSDMHADAIKRGVIDPARLPPVSGNASSFGGWTPQEWYDAIHPIGTCFMKTQKTGAPPLPYGVVATWIFQDTNSLVKALPATAYTGTPTNPQFGGNAFATTGAAGGHDHGGASGFLSLTTSHLPPHSHTVPAGGSDGPIHSTGYAVGATIQNSATQNSGSVGGGAGHNHPIGGQADHTHPVTIDPPFIAVQLWIRTA